MKIIVMIDDEDALRQMLKFLNETDENFDKNLEGQRREIKELERYGGHGGRTKSRVDDADGE